MNKQPKLTPEVMQTLRSKPGFLPLKVADYISGRRRPCV